MNARPRSSSGSGARLLTLGAQDLHVQVRQAAGGRQRQLDHALDGDRVAVQVVEEGAVLVVVGHQPQLSPGAVVWRRVEVVTPSSAGTPCPRPPARPLTFVVRRNESQDVFVPQHDGLVDLGLSKPGALLSGREDLHGHVPAPPLPPPYFAEASFPDDLLQDDGPGHRPLHKERQTWGEDRQTKTSWPVWTFGFGWKAARELTRAGSRGGHVIDEVLQRLVFGQVDVVAGGVLHLQPLPVAVGPLVILEEEHAQHQQHTEEEDRPGDDRH